MAKPATIVKIALYQDGRVQCGLEGAGDKSFVARGLAVAIQSILDRLDLANREPTIEVPAESVQKELLGAR